MRGKDDVGWGLYQSESVRAGLADRGYVSSVHISHEPEHKFVKRVRDILSEDEAKKVYRHAERRSALLTHLATAHATASRRDVRAVEGQFENIPDYQEIFGSLDYCSCPKCKSIFGPAAYFVDLMRIIGKYIVLDESPTAVSRPVPLHERREDLWDLVLSCENTNQEMPYLQMVNTILEKYNGQGEEIYVKISKSLYPHTVPFCLPLEKARIWLGRQNLSLEVFLAQWGMSMESIVSESLKLSPELFTMLESRLAPEQMNRLLGVSQCSLEEMSKLSVFMERLQIGRDELYLLLEQDISAQEEGRQALLHSLFINRGMENEGYIYLKDDTVAGLDMDNLERVVRFVRTAKIMQVTFPELECMMRAAGYREDGSFSLETLWKMRQSVRGLKTDCASAMAYFDRMKDYGEDAANLYRSVFGRSRAEMEQIVSPVERFRVLSDALHTETGNLNLLKDYFGETETIGEDVYYRHIQAARLLGLTVEDYVGVLAIIFTDKPYVFTPESLEELILFVQKAGLDLSVWFQLMDLRGDGMDAVVDFAGLHEKIAFWRANLSEREAEEEAKESYVYTQLADYFSLDPETMKELFSCVLTEEELKQWPKKILSDETYDEIDAVVRAMARYLLLNRSGIPAELLCTVTECAEIFGIADVRSLTRKNVSDILSFDQYRQMWEDTDGKLYRYAEEFKGNWLQTKLLSETAGWDDAQVQKLAVRFFPKEGEQPMLPAFVERIAGAVYLLGKMSLGEEEAAALCELAGLGYTDYAKAKELAEGLLDSSFDGTAQALLEAAKRDALLPVTLAALRTVYSDMTEYDKLYKYFLIDVEMDEKTMISPVKEGINALQLYLLRCRMHLESGIAEVKIPDSWWEWMMDYTKWEANRRVFVYPENYLLPSVRHSKTSLFQEVETALQQSKITDGFMEEQYVKYLDNYFGLTQLKICGAYETIENYYNVLYIFARTKQVPYTYYYCRQVGTLAWSEWEKIDAAIDSEVINPVFVFNRLHIFWTSVQEKEKVKLGDNEETLSADNQRAYLLQIKYTYKNLQDKWIAPQTLVEDETIYAVETGDTAKTSEETADRFGIYSQPESFQKLMLLRLTGDNLKGVWHKAEDEFLAVITGGFSLNLEEEINKIDLDCRLDTCQEHFADKLNRIIANNNFEVWNQENGYLNTGFFRVYNEELEEASFIHEKEFAVVDGYVPAVNSRIYHVCYDKIHHAVGASLSRSVLRNAALVPTGVLPFKNNGDTDVRPALDKTSFITADKTGAVTISADLSEKIFAKLQAEDIIDSDGYVDEIMLANSDLMEFLGGILDANEESPRSVNRILAIEDILFKNMGALYFFEQVDKAQVIPVVNQPGKFIFDSGDEAFLVYPVYEKEGRYYPVNLQKTDQGTTAGLQVSFNTFVKMGIERQTAIQITDALRDAGVVEEGTGIVNLAYCTRSVMEEALAGVKFEGTDRKKVLDRIYGRLLSLPVISEDDMKNIAGIDGSVIIDILKAQEAGVLYPWNEDKKSYRIDLRQMKEKTNLVFKNSDGARIADSAAEEIYRRLSEAVSSLQFQYRVNDDLPESFTDALFCEWKFTVTRLTNPTIKKLKRKLEIGGIKSFLNRETQSEPKEPIMPFSRFAPTPNVIPPTALDGAQIDFDGLYGEYNWELFYHIPMMIAQNLTANNCNEESRKWMQYVFDPTKTNDGSEEKYYWNFVPFVKNEEESLRQMLSDPMAIQAYNDSPFDPHAIARLRTDAYEKYTVMEYVDNLLQWGDAYFVQNTWESLISATMLYVWAKDLLGPRPVEIKENGNREDKSFRQIEDYYAKDPQGIPQFIIELDEKLMDIPWEEWDIREGEEVPFNDIRAYFGVPENENMLAMWDKVEDRLFKIRNSLDINGAKRITALYEPEKDPLTLVKQAAASGSSTPGALAAEGSLYPYRFRYMLTQAREVTAQLIQFSSELSAALEKQDAEQMMQLSASQEQTILEMGISVRENQLKEAEFEYRVLEARLQGEEERRDYYKKNIEEYISDRELSALAAADAAEAFRTISGTTCFAAGAAHLAPQVGSPFAMKYGGLEIGESLKGIAAGYDTLAGIFMHVSNQSLTMAQYDRRKEEWELQLTQTMKEIEALEQQMEAASLRQKAAERNLMIQQKELEHKKEVMNFLKNKFTGAQLYQWVAGRLQSAVWQTYQLALELALSAQAAYSYERGEEASFLKFDYWDEGKKGLMAGESLMLSLMQMEQSFEKKNYRCLQIEKHISMAHAFPEALQAVKESGCCEFQLEERLFAEDYPGCYNRRIAKVSVSVPAVLPPYETIKATLKQQKSYYLTAPDTKGIDWLFADKGEMPASVKVCSRYGEKIAVSKGVDDSGMFTLDFQDERYLPFEGTGVHSSWRMEMPACGNHFDMDTVSDIILTVCYTALEDEKRGSGSYYDHVVQACKS